MAFINLKTWYTEQSNVVKSIVVFSITVLIIGVIFLFNICLMKGVTNHMMAPIYQSDQTLKGGIQGIPRPNYVPAIYFETLKTQEQIMDERKVHHWELAKLFFRNYYSILMLSIILSCVGGLTLFALINRGWANAGTTLQSFFLTLATALAFVGFFPLVFKQQENFTQNMMYYENYSKGQLTVYDQLVSLQNPVRSAIGDTILAKKPLVDSLWYRKLDSLVSTNNKLLKEYTNYVLAIDPAQVKSISDVYNILQRTVKASSDSTRK